MHTYINNINTCFEKIHNCVNVSNYFTINTKITGIRKLIIMSNEDQEDEFNQCYIIMEVKEVDKKYQSFAHINELDEIINTMK